VLDSADKPRPGVRCNPCAFATASRRAPRANSATSNWKVIPPSVILCAIDFRVPVK
jgi:hypothetical protein